MKNKKTISDIQSAMEDEKGQGSRGQSFQVFNLPEGTSGSLRFLPDADEGNDLFWVEGRTQPLLFCGAVGGEQETDEPVVVRFPSLETWGQKDPITEYFRKYWKGDDESRNYARSYYRQPYFLYSFFVSQWPSIEQSPPDNPIRNGRISKGLHERIKLGLTNAEFEMSPTDYDEGRDFKVIKGKRGEWASYDQSAFSYKSRALTDVERAALDRYGLVDLGAMLGEAPTAEAKATLLSMFEDSLAGLPFDQGKYPEFKAWPSRKAPVARPGSSAVPVRTPSQPVEMGQASPAIIEKLRSRVTATTGGK